MDIYKNIDRIFVHREIYRDGQSSSARVYTIFQISISICLAGYSRESNENNRADVSRSRVVIRHLTFSMQSRRQRSGKRDIYIHTYIWPAARATFVVSYIWKRIHGPIILDRYFSAESYLVNFIESSNQIGDKSRSLHREKIISFKN